MYRYCTYARAARRREFGTQINEFHCQSRCSTLVARARTSCSIKKYHEEEATKQLLKGSIRQR